MSKTIFKKITNLEICRNLQPDLSGAYFLLGSLVVFETEISGKK
jgi:hypothetical protein